MSTVPNMSDNEKHDDGVSPSAAKRLRDAMDRLLAGRPQRTDGRLIKDNLWKEAGLSRTTMNRAVRILAEWNCRVVECDGFTPSEARKNDEVARLRKSSKTKLVCARSSTIGSTQPLPQSPRCITTTCCYVKNSTIAANSSRYKSTAEPATLLPRRSSNQLHSLTSTSPSGVPGGFLNELHAGGESEFGVDVGEVGLHGAR